MTTISPTPWLAHLAQCLLNQLVLQVLLDVARGLVQNVVILRGQVQLPKVETG